MRLSLLALLLAVVGIWAIEHDSVCEEGSADCPEPSHLVIRLAKRDDTLAAAIADQHDMRVVGRPFLDSHYFLEHVDDSKKTKRHKREAVERLRDSADVEWVEEQRPRSRVKRDYTFFDDTADQSFSTNDRHKRSDARDPKRYWPDPLYPEQWYLVKGAVGNYDMNVIEAWDLGYTGKNVSVSILDDGIQRDHLDLYSNYDPMASTDINDHDDDPTPQNNGDNKHGTRCAGEVAAIAGNNQCGVGVAYNAKIGGVRMLDGPVSDSVEAASLSLNQHHIDIYSASWGPEDDGKTFDGPGPLARQAFYKGIKEGRGGKGNIFVWASGNGGQRQDSCSADGYTTSIYTLSISSATFDNHRPWYLEECPSSIATTYSSANMNEPAIVTVDVPSGCTKKHTGTSASAPLAAGIIALALEANPSLTWRDMQHIVLRTANPTPLLNNPGWSTNGVGRKISNKFGYGLMDGGALVKMAKKWQTVPEQHMCTYEYKLSEPNPRPLTSRSILNFTLSVGGCESGTPVLYLEHVQVVATVRFGKRGDLRLTLYSPRGTRSELLPPRPQDFNTNGFHKWPFLSVQMWGEDPRGDWTLTVETVSENRNLGGTFHDWMLLLYGTESPAQSNDPVYAGAVPVSASARHRADGTTQVQFARSPDPFAGFTAGDASFPAGDGFGGGDPTSAAASSVGGYMAADTEAKNPQELTYGDLKNAGNCHPECDDSGCHESQSATGCFKCRNLAQSQRNRAGFKCVSTCDAGYFEDKAQHSCKMCSPKCKTCSQQEVCDSCTGAQLLIDVDHYGQLDHGQCVAECPKGLMTDYDSDPLQPKCILPKNPCAKGYFFAGDGRGSGSCAVCHEACATCHGPSPVQCDQCNTGYANKTVGYCRPCCKSGEQPDVVHCGSLQILPASLLS
uniref:P/Homo B domain-containing protein n=1 Tax=Plectus sambesii TaxID=2011161 RepID=A0A914VV88_9BILA